MSERNNEEQPTVEVGWGPVKVSKIPLRDVIKFFTGPKFIAGLVGFIIGSALTLLAVFQLQQPSLLIRPVISSAVSATIAAQPTATTVPTPTPMPTPTPVPTPTPMPTATPMPTPTPSLVLKLLDASTSMPLLPERGEYKLNPGQRIMIKVEPAHDKMYRWDATPNEKFEPRMPTGPWVTFLVPEKHDQLTVVTVCELNEDLSCPAGRERTILIRAIASEK